MKRTTKKVAKKKVSKRKVSKKKVTSKLIKKKKTKKRAVKRKIVKKKVSVSHTNYFVGFTVNGKIKYYNGGDFDSNKSNVAIFHNKKHAEKIAVSLANAIGKPVAVYSSTTKKKAG